MFKFDFNSSYPAVMTGRLPYYYRRRMEVFPSNQT